MPPAIKQPLRQSLLKHLTITSNNSLTDNPRGTDTEPQSHHTNSIAPAPPTPQEMVVARDAFKDQQQFIENLDQEASDHERIIRQQQSQIEAGQKKIGRLEQLLEKYKASRNVPNTSAEDLFNILNTSNEVLNTSNDALGRENQKERARVKVYEETIMSYEETIINQQDRIDALAERIAFLESELLAGRRVCEMAIPRQIQAQRESISLQQHNGQLLQNLSKQAKKMQALEKENAKLRKEMREREQQQSGTDRQPGSGFGEVVSLWET